MSLECGIDGNLDFQVDLSDPLITSSGTEECVECHALIFPKTAHYRATEYEMRWDEYGDFRDELTPVGIHPVCEACGDLALSWLELGYCWSYGELRADIAELNRD